LETWKLELTRINTQNSWKK